jgi:hypothetical protein
MNVYRVTFGNGDTIDLELPGAHVPPEIILGQLAEHHLGPAGQVAAFITRDPGTPAERVVWRRLDANRSERIVELENGTPKTVRLFVSFAYEHPEENRTVFGSTVLDMDFEPYEPEHIDHLQAQIATHISVHRVVIMGWKKFGEQS